LTLELRPRSHSSRFRPTLRDQCHARPNPKRSSGLFGRLRMTGARRRAPRRSEHRTLSNAFGFSLNPWPCCTLAIVRLGRPCDASQGS
ncbi:hypothetical protein HETIRDRAFT_319052, partial [Heterobasidion irregulare TC 32-1]